MNVELIFNHARGVEFNYSDRKQGEQDLEGNSLGRFVGVGNIYISRRLWEAFLALQLECLCICEPATHPDLQETGWGTQQVGHVVSGEAQAWAQQSNPSTKIGSRTHSETFCPQVLSGSVKPVHQPSALPAPALLAIERFLCRL